MERGVQEPVAEYLEVMVPVRLLAYDRKKRPDWDVTCRWEKAAVLTLLNDIIIISVVIFKTENIHSFFCIAWELVRLQSSEESTVNTI
jgi:hypothetical protein